MALRIFGCTLALTCLASHAVIAQAADVTVGGNDPILEIRDQSGSDSNPAATLRLLETSGAGNEAGGYLAYDGSGNRMEIGTVTNGARAPAMTVRRTGGRVGIGTLSPATKLHVVGDGSVGTDVFVQDADFARMRLEAEGSDPNEVNLSVQARNSAAAQRAEVGTTTSHDLVLFANGDVRLRIESSGAVCIGNC